MLNQKDISTWNSGDVQNWLKSINMTQYISKFESNKINGYDLIYLTKEDLKSLGIVSIHDKNIILNSMKEALLQQLKLNVNFKDKNITIQLDFEQNYTVEQLSNTLKLIFKPISSIFLVANNNEILMPNLKIIDLILYNPKVYKNFKIMLDSQLVNSTPTTFSNKDYSNNNDLLNNKPIISLPPKSSSNINKKKYENYYKINAEENYNTDNNNTNPFNKTDFNNKNEKYQNTFITLDNNELNKNYLEKNDKYKNKYNANNKNNSNNEIKFKTEDPIINKYQTYGDFIKSNNLKNNDFNTDLDNKNINNYEKIESKRDSKNKNNNDTMGLNLNKDYKLNNNNIYDFNRNITPNQNEARRTKTLSTYRKKYSIENGELNLLEEDNIKNRINNNNNLKYGTFNKEEDDDNQKFSSEKRNFRTSEFKFNENENNNINNNNYMNKNSYNYRLNNGLINRNNYEFNSLIGTKDKVNDKMNNTSGFNDFRQYNNANDFGLKYN